MKGIIAVLSTTVIPVDGTYIIETIKKVPEIRGVPSYIGHPDTKKIVEDLGAIPATTKLFKGLKVGESAIAFAIKQDKSTRNQKGYTENHQNVTIDDLSVRIVTRIEDVKNYLIIHEYRHGPQSVFMYTKKEAYNYFNSYDSKDLRENESIQIMVVNDNGSFDEIDYKER